MIDADSKPLSGPFNKVPTSSQATEPSLCAAPALHASAAVPPPSPNAAPPAALLIAPHAVPYHASARCEERKDFGLEYQRHFNR